MKFEFRLNYKILIHFKYKQNNSIFSCIFSIRLFDFRNKKNNKTHLNLEQKFNNLK